MDARNKGNVLPETFESIEAAAEFWDTHDLADYWDETSEAHFEVELERRVVLVPLEGHIARKLADVARRQGISTETLVNVWLSERLQEVV
jgi:hypothetical protein